MTFSGFCLRSFKILTASSTVENFGPGINEKLPTGVPITRTPLAIASKAGNGPVSHHFSGPDVINKISIFLYLKAVFVYSLIFDKPLKNV